MKKILVLTEKPFAKAAVESIKDIVSKAGYTFALVEKYESESEMLNTVKDANALIIRSDKITSQIMDAAPNLEIIVRAGAGYDNIDLHAATMKNIVVMNTPGQNSNAVAELVIGMLIYYVRNFFNGKSGTELKGKTLGLHAFGNVGQQVARIAKGLEMKIYAFDPFLSDKQISSMGVTPVYSVEELYSKSQYVSLHIPAVPETIQSINYNLLKLMPAHAVLINTARKEIIHEQDIIKLMNDRNDLTYLSDIAPDNQSEFENNFSGRFYFTPKKMGAQTAEANINAGIAAANQITDFFASGNTKFKVN